MKNVNENGNGNGNGNDVLLEKEPKAPPLLEKAGGENKNSSGGFSTKKNFFSILREFKRVITSP